MEGCAVMKLREGCWAVHTDTCETRHGILGLRHARFKMSLGCW